MKRKYFWIAAIASLFLLLAGVITMFSATLLVENGASLTNAVSTALVGATMCLPYLIIKLRFF